MAVTGGVRSLESPALTASAVCANQLNGSSRSG